MKNLLHLKIIIIIAFIHSHTILGQPNVSIQSPNVSSLGKFNEIPVSYFTGVPDISVPLYNIKVGEWSMPITLRYHATAFNPNEQPGWVGAGWALSTGGVISRKVNGWPDDYFCYSPWKGYAFTGYYLNKDLHPQINGYQTYAGISHEVQKDIYADEIMDGQPDEFNFNFNGYSGKFIFRNGSAPVVVGNSGIKVEVYADLHKDRIFEPFEDGTSEPWEIFSIKGFRITTPDGYKYEFGHRWDVIDDKMYAVERSEKLKDTGSKFKITNAWYLVRVLSPKNKELITLTYDECQWKNEVNYPYPNPSTLKNTLSLSRNAGYVQSGITRDMSIDLSGQIIYPCYLKQINTPHQTINFSTAESVQLRPYYADFLANIVPFVSEPAFSDIERKLGNWNISTSEFVYDKIAYPQLENLIVKDRISNNTIKNFRFHYTQNDKERLRLLKLEEEGLGSYLFDYNELNNRFLLNESIDRIPEIIEYANIEVDHWGYYNREVPSYFLEYAGRPVRISHSNRRTLYDFNFRNTLPDNIYDKLEVAFNSRLPQPGNVNFSLKKIIYPTGGYTLFEYEPHTYVKTVERSSNGMPYLEPISSGEQQTGGIRIKSVKFYDGKNASPQISKEYIYEMGILTGIPKYYAQYKCKVYIQQKSIGRFFGHPYCFSGINYKNIDKLFSSSSIIPVSSNGSGSYIGYSKVTEIQEGNGKTEFFFRNFQDHPSLYSQSQLDNHLDLHLDDYNARPLEINCLPSNAIFPITNFEMERGMQIGLNVFDESTKMQRKERYYFSKPDDISGYTILTTFQKKVSMPFNDRTMYNGACTNAIHTINMLFNYKYNYYYYPFNLSRKTVTEYLPNDSIHTESYYTYASDASQNYNYLLSESTTINNGKKIEKQYWNVNRVLNQNPGTSYLGEYKTLKEMQNTGMPLTTIEEQSFEVLPNGKKSLLAGKLIKYKDFGAINYRPSETYQLQANIQNKDTALVGFDTDGNLVLNTMYEKDVQFDRYDVQGNLLQVQEKNGMHTAYIWSYNYRYPVAEIKNATYEEVKAALNYQDTQMEALAANKNPDINLIDTQLRTYFSGKQKLITTCTYQPSVGILISTDHQGIKTYYAYDTANRLKEIYLKEGDTKKVIKYYDYHYRNK